MRTLRRRLAATLGCAALTAGALVSVSGAGADAVTAPGTAPRAAAAPAVSPPGANDFDCKPNKKHPQPVVLVNGTFETMDKNWASMSPYLADKGYCVFAFNYGNRATGPIGRSAHRLRKFSNRVRKATGRARVDLVGHSQGGMMPRYYLKFLGGAKKVDDLVGLAPSNHGTRTPIEPPTGTAGASPCAACNQQSAGSKFLKRLNRGGDTQKGPDYTVISTRYDEVVMPWQSQRLSGPKRRITNTLIQAKCPGDTIEHDQTPNDPVVQQIVLNALRVHGPSREKFQPECTPAG